MSRLIKFPMSVLEEWMKRAVTSASKRLKQQDLQSSLSAKHDPNVKKNSDFYLIDLLDVLLQLGIISQKTWTGADPSDFEGDNYN